MMGWIELPLTLIGEVNLEDTNVQLFSYPNSVRSLANEVLVYAYVEAGYTANVASDIRFFTQIGDTIQFGKYLHIRGWPQNAHTVTSDNMWLPAALDRKLRVQVSNAMSGNMVARVYIIGYR